MLDLIRALQRAVDAAGELRTGIGRVEALVGIHGGGGVRIGGNLPAGEIDRLQAGTDHLHRLVAGKGAERVDVVFRVEAFPELVRAARGERVLDGEGAAQLLNVFDAVVALNIVEPALGCAGNEVVESLAHGFNPRSRRFWVRGPGFSSRLPAAKSVGKPAA